MIVANSVKGEYMKHLSLKLLAEMVTGRRKTLKISQAALAEKTGINRSILSRLEMQDYSPSVDQLLSLSAALGFDTDAVIVDDEATLKRVYKGPQIRLKSDLLII